MRRSKLSTVSGSHSLPATAGIDAASNNGSKASAAFTADLFGDWRE